MFGSTLIVLSVECIDHISFHWLRHHYCLNEVASLVHMHSLVWCALSGGRESVMLQSLPVIDGDFVQRPDYIELVDRIPTPPGVIARWQTKER